VQYRIAAIIRRLKYRLRLWKLGVSEKYLSDAFSFLAQIDTFESWYEAQHPVVPWVQIRFTGCGNEVQIKAVTNAHHQLSHYVIRQAADRTIRVEEWRESTRSQKMEIGPPHDTHWHEVFRSGSHIQNADWYSYLKILYGNGEQMNGKPTDDKRHTGTEIHEGG
jgi:hypothetical protein